MKKEQTQKERTPGDRLLAQAIDRQQRGLPAEAQTLVVDRAWREPPEQQTLTVTYRRTSVAGQPVHQAVVDGRAVSLDHPQRLTPISIPKPWGREIWFTGMEARGESAIALGETDTMPLGTYLALAPVHLTGGRTPVLLKILDPRPEPVLGELYLEVHETKQEVYVVTAIDAAAWPDGTGSIRYGVNQAKRREFDSDSAFRAAFLAALSRYEQVRLEVDEGATGLETKETEAREMALGFTDARPLRTGDVISVPTWVPHSLQQGVRVVEFQTPTYERYILSSSQKVLTQDSWDSAHAVENMLLDTPADSPPEQISENIQRIVHFDDFGVWRVSLEAGTPLVLPPGLPYALAYCISGRVELGGRGSSLGLTAGEAALIPAHSVDCDHRADSECLILVAAPGL